MFCYDFGGAILRSKRYCAFFFQSYYQNYIYTLLEPVDPKLLHTKLCIADNLKFWVGFKSHKHGCLCSTNSDRRIREFGIACGHV